MGENGFSFNLPTSYGGYGNSGSAFQLGAYGSDYGSNLVNSLDTSGLSGVSQDQGSWMDNLSNTLFGGKNADGSQSTGYLTGGLGALQGLGNLYLGMQSYGLAKDQLALQKQAYQTNLANQVSSYNTALEDKIRGRTSNYDGKEADVQSYLASHKLST